MKKIYTENCLMRENMAIHRNGIKISLTYDNIARHDQSILFYNSDNFVATNMSN